MSRYKSLPPDLPGKVYVMRAGERGPVKIGFTSRGEINHDYLHTLRDRPELFDTLLRELAGSSIPAALNKHGRRYEYAPGVYILGQRHHSEPEWKQGK